MPPVRLTVVSDSHLSRRAPEAAANWDAVVEHLELDQPDLVVHAGDLTLDATHDPHELTDARAQLDRLSVAWRAIPGNHDIGDNPRPGLAAAETVDDERRRRWLDTIGPDWWRVDLDGWTLVGVDAQLFASGLVAEAEQQAWLDDQLAGAPGNVALVVHKPIVGPAAEVAAAPPYRFVPAPARAWLADRLAGGAVALVVSGHVHQFRVLDVDGVRHAWAPTTWTVFPEEMQATFGTKRGGVLAIDLEPHGPGEPRLVEPPGFRQLLLGRDVPTPQPH